MFKFNEILCFNKYLFIDNYLLHQNYVEFNISTMVWGERNRAPGNLPEGFPEVFTLLKTHY